MLKLLLIILSDIQQGSMAAPTAISTDQLIDPNMSLDPKFLVPIEDTVGSDPTQSTHLSDKDNKSFISTAIHRGQ